ncbi:MAG TPA: hypothetical protein VF411_12945 [Bacteroidia bacterium]
MRKVIFIVVMAFCLNTDAQTWVPGPKGLDSPPQAGVVFNDNIYLIESHDKGDVLLLMGDTSFTEVATFPTIAIWKLVATNSEMYLIERFTKNPAIYSFDGKKIHAILLPDSALEISSTIVFKEQLFINVKFKNSSSCVMMAWNGKEWNTLKLKTEITQGGIFFIYKEMLYYEVRVGFDSKDIYIFKLEGNTFNQILKKETELYIPNFTIEYNSLTYLFDTSSDLYFTFDGTNLQKKAWALKFDNYGSSEMFFIPFDNKLYLAGHFWCDVKDARSIICFDGKKWKSTSTGLERYITVFLKNKGALYAFGMEDGVMFSTKFVK